MNKKQLLSLAAAALIGASQSFAAVEYWVATNGSDENPGTEAKPFATPEMAVLMVKDNEETIIHLEKDATFMMAGQLNLDKNKICTIEGDNTTLKGAEKPGFEGGEAVRIFRAADNSKVTLRGLNFVNGRQVEYVLGGAIYFAGEELNVDKCRFIDNEAGSCGAAIGSRGHIVRVTNSYFEHNYIIGGGARGAAIMQRGPETMDGELYVDNCTFYNNSLNQGGQGYCIAIYDPSNQPGVNFAGCKKMQVTNSTFVGNTSKDNYQACIDISNSTDCETILANNTFYDNDGVLRLYFQLEPVYMFNNFAYCNRSCVLSECSIADTDRAAITAHNNIFYGAERSVNENMDDPDFNANAAAAHNILGLCKDATMTALGVSTTLGNRDEAFVPFLPILRDNSPLVNAGIDNSSEWLAPNVIPATDCRGYYPADKVRNDVGAYEYGGVEDPDRVAVEVVDVDNSEAPVEYFNLQGMRVNNPSNGIFIRRQGAKATKVRL